MNEPPEWMPTQARGLDRLPRLRRISAALWSAFLGAALATPAIYLMPESWLQAPTTFEGAAGLFFTMWAVALATAVFSMVLAEVPRSER